MAVTPVDSSKTASLPTRRKPKDKKTSSKENKQFDSGEIGEEPPPWKAGVLVVFSFSGGNLGPGWPAACVSSFVRVCPLCIVSYYHVIIFQRAEKYGRRRESS